MRLIALMIEFLLPFILVGGAITIFYRYYKFNTAYKSWKNQKEKIRLNYHTFSFDKLQEDWKNFVSLFKKYTPTSSQKYFDSITQNIEELQKKAQTENWDKSRPTQIRPLYDIVYSHIPDLVEEIMEMPKSLASTKTNYEGKTATQLFEENMALLSQSTKEIVEQTFSDNLKELSVHKLYLQKKFGSN